MLDAAVVRDDPERVRAALESRGLQADAVLDELSQVGDRRRALIVEVETLKREQNVSGEEVARLKRLGQDASPLFQANRERAQRIKQLDAELERLHGERQGMLLT